MPQPRWKKLTEKDLKLLKTQIVQRAQKAIAKQDKDELSFLSLVMELIQAVPVLQAELQVSQRLKEHQNITLPEYKKLMPTPEGRIIKQRSKP